ncbi:glycerol-3-phosphate 1-O-acyltransferase PlsY [Desulfovibrio litoralis]|uniref:Glycerol-3-phosphate acyltransferase n=1 Tax=Desulfovibrio litoralis DSM 11393 TaxID=1121455 RepID=A0A1M7RWD4_9BACT|nr:glycerol-3-phosphate 1-O-acyltransferase PlsY [Desulfovibrio litoralis]SHN50540.1 acyl-phosphate glycerol-3-phosphate acyltransferase [Desulfovibrio litoralis DSM 11393]
MSSLELFLERSGLLWIIGAYLLGSIPFGLIIAKVFCGIDPRTDGSRNVGSTNVARLCGKKYGFLTLFCDALKGALPVWFSQGVYISYGFNRMAETFNMSSDAVLGSLVALACIVGHSRSIFLKFKGGKAVATTVGVFIPLAFWQLLFAGLVCILVILKTRFVSLGSLVLVTLLPIALAVSGKYDLLPLALIISAIVFIKHKDNIQRLLNGDEKPWIKTKKDEDN